MKKCNKMSNLMSSYIDNQLDDSDRLDFLQHIKECTSCKEELDELLNIVNLCKSIGDVELPEFFKTELHKKLLLENDKEIRINERKTSSIWNRYVKIGSAIAACFLIVFLLKGFISNNYFYTAKKDKSAETEIAAQDMGAAPLEEKMELNAQNFKGEEDAEFENDAKEKLTDDILEIPDTSRHTDAASRITAMGADESSSIDNKNVDIVFNVDNNIDSNIDVQVDRIKEFALSNGAELSDYAPESFIEVKGDENGMMKVSGVSEINSTSDVYVFYLKVRNDNYKEFISSFKSNFKDSNIEIGSLEIIDCSEILENMKLNLLEIDKMIQENEKNERNKKISNPDDLERLKADRQDIWDRMERIQLDSSYTFLTFKVKNKQE